MLSKNTIIQESHHKTYLLSFALFVLGAAVCQFFAPDMGCTLFLLIIVAIGAFFSKIFSSGDKDAFRAFWLLFGASIFACGISCIYRHWAMDSVQNELDAYDFFKKSTALEDPLIFPEEGLNRYYFRFATLPWMLGYRVIAFFGFAQDQYVGQFINTLLLSIGGLFTVKAVLLTLPEYKNAGRIAGNLLASYCFMYVMGSIMLRDVFGFTYIAILFYLCVRFIVHVNFLNFLLLLICILFGWFTLEYLRDSMQYIPLMTVGLVAIAYAYSRFGWIGLLGLFAIGCCLLLITLKLGIINKDLTELALGYNDLSSSSDSLAYGFIFNKPLYVRWLLGFWYLLVFPFPVLSSLNSPDSYGLYKALAGIWMILMVPTAFSAIWAAFYSKSTEMPPRIRTVLLFSAFLFVTDYVAVGLTSIETRHTTPAVTAIIMLTTYGLVSANKYKTTFRLFWYASLISGHIIWMTIKFL